MNKWVNSDEANYRILNLDVSLRSDSNELLDLFERDYGWFRVPGPVGGTRLSFLARLENQKDRFIQVIRAAASERACQPPRTIYHESLSDHPSPGSYCLQFMIRTLFAELPAFVVLHAAVAERDGAAVALAGPPGTGKTTLIMELMKQGLRFFSDDICPIHRETRLVHPFPRSLWVSSLASGDDREFRRGKRPVGLNRFKGYVGTGPCSLRAIICLDAGLPPSPVQELELGARKCVDRSVISALRDIPGVVVTPTGIGNGAYRVRFCVESNVIGAIRHVLARHEKGVWNVYRVGRLAPDFDRNPTLSPIPLHQAAFALLQDMKNEPEEIRLAGNPGRLLYELNGLLASAPTYQMTVGRLEEMVQQVVFVLDKQIRPVRSVKTLQERM